MNRVLASFTLLFLLVSGSAQDPGEPIPPDFLNQYDQLVYDPSRYAPIFEERFQYLTPEKMKEGLILISQNLRDLYKQDHAERILCYTQLEFFSLMQLVEQGVLSAKEEKQVVSYFYYFFSRPGLLNDKLNKGDLRTGNAGLDLRLNLFASVYNNHAETILSYLDKCLDANPDTLTISLLKAGTCFAFKNWQEAITWYDRVCILSPDNAYARYMRGMAYASLMEKERAIADLEESLRLYPENPNAVHNLAFLYHDVGNFADALKACRNVLGYDQSNPVYYDLAGYCLVKLDQADSAMIYYEEAMKLAPDYLPIYLRMGDVYHSRNEFTVAAYIYSKALASDPDFFPALVSRGNSYLRAGAYEKAVIDLKRAKVMDDKDLYVTLRLADCYYQSGHYQEAIPLYQDAIKLDYDDPDAYEMLGFVFMQLKDRSRELYYFEEALKRNPDDPPILTNLGWLFYLKGDFAKCLDYSEKAYTLDPDQYIPRFNAAIAMLRLGEVDRSYAMYRTILEDEPGIQTEGAIEDLKDLIEKNIMKKQARYILREIFKLETI